MTSEVFNEDCMDVMHRRKHKGWSIERIFSTPKITEKGGYRPIVSQLWLTDKDSLACLGATGKNRGRKFLWNM